jgi:hypothetical protein
MPSPRDRDVSRLNQKGNRKFAPRRLGITQPTARHTRHSPLPRRADHSGKRDKRASPSWADRKIQPNTRSGQAAILADATTLKKVFPIANRRRPYPGSSTPFTSAFPRFHDSKSAHTSIHTRSLYYFCDSVGSSASFAMPPYTTSDRTDNQHLPDRRSQSAPDCILVSNVVGAWVSSAFVGFGSIGVSVSMAFPLPLFAVCAPRSGEGFSTY